MKPVLLRRSLVALLACAGLAGASASPAPPAPTIKLAIDLSYSGTGGPAVASLARAIDLAVREANSAGLPDHYHIETVRFDHGVPGKNFDADLAAQNARDNVADPQILAVYGTMNSGAAKAEIPILNAAHLAMVSATNTNPGLTKGSSAEALRADAPGANAYYRVCGTDDLQGSAGAQLMSQMGAKRVYVIDDNDTYGKGLADVFTVAFQASGGQVVAHEQTSLDQRDFWALIARIKAAHPDAVYFGGEGYELGRFRADMASAGIGSIPLVGGDSMNNDAFTQAAGPAAAGSYFTVMTPNGLYLDNQRAKHFTRSFENSYHTAPLPYDAGAYASAQVLISAIKRAIRAEHGAMPTRSEINRMVASTHLETAIGPISFTAEGDVVTPYVSYYNFDQQGKKQFLKQLSLHVAAR